MTPQEQATPRPLNAVRAYLVACVVTAYAPADKEVMQARLDAFDALVLERDQLRADVARLREALEEIAATDDPPDRLADPLGLGKNLRGCLRIARAALLATQRESR